MGELHRTRSRAKDMLAVVVWTSAVFIWGAGTGAQAQSPGQVRHPMDPLIAEEYERSIAILQAAGLTDEFGLYPFVTLHEPDKADVLEWRDGEPVARAAFVVVRNGSDTFQSVVDISGARVVSWEPVEGAEPGILMTEEWNGANRIVRAHAPWREAVRQRGIDLTGIVCVPQTAGYYALAAEEGRRLVKVVCYSSSDAQNFWGRPIEGLVAVVDLNERAVIDLIDMSPVPIPRGPVDFSEASVGDLRASSRLRTAQPDGPGFTLNGNMVRWQGWEFHVRVDPRLGLVLSRVMYDDAGSLRSVLYQASLSELFVPYMDPSAGWFFRTYLDAGEYGVGKLAVEMQPGLDCPEHAVFRDAVFVDDYGDPYRTPRAACLFERDAGDIAWRHTDAVTGQSEVRRSTELVVRLVSAIGNYDYVFDWVFRQDGAIRVVVGASGVEQVKGVASRTRAEAERSGDTAYGRLVAERTVAVNHDHFFNFRLDFDVDGTRNSLVVDRLRTQRLPARDARRSVWTIDRDTVAREHAARLRINIERPALWRVVNPETPGPLGYPTSYELRPRGNAVSLLSPDDYPQLRAGFTDFHLWVTPYDQNERYAAGLFPNQSRGGDGLSRWTRGDRPIENTDVVLWYTMGSHHVVRAEDWPVLPTTRHEFELRPFDFFERNPALDIPE